MSDSNQLDIPGCFAVLRNPRAAGWEKEVALKRIEEQLEALQGVVTAARAVDAVVDPDDATGWPPLVELADALKALDATWGRR